MRGDWRRYSLRKFLELVLFMFSLVYRLNLVSVDKLFVYGV